jgi:hypothetical protein
MYGVLGILHLYLARDVVRYLDLIVVIDWFTVVAGAAGALGLPRRIRTSRSD